MTSPGLTSGLAAGRAEFLERDAALGLQADIDDGEFVGEADDAAGDDGAVEAGVPAERLIEKGGEIFAAAGAWSAGAWSRARAVEADAMCVGLSYGQGPARPDRVGWRLRPRAAGHGLSARLARTGLQQEGPRRSRRSLRWRSIARVSKVKEAPRTRGSDREHGSLPYISSLVYLAMRRPMITAIVPALGGAGPLRFPGRGRVDLRLLRRRRASLQAGRRAIRVCGGRRRVGDGERR